MGAKVIVTEVDELKALEAVMDGFEVMPMRLAPAIILLAESLIASPMQIVSFLSTAGLITKAIRLPCSVLAAI